MWGRGARGPPPTGIFSGACLPVCLPNPPSRPPRPALLCPQLFIAAAEAAAAHQRWKSSGDSRPLNRSQSLKRKWAAEGAAAANENAAANGAN